MPDNANKGEQLEITLQRQKVAELQKELTSYEYDYVVEKSKEYFDGDELAANVWISKYALKDSQGNIYETNPDDMHHRLAKEIGRIEAKYPQPMLEEEVYDLIKGFKYLVPQGGPMTGIGNQFQIASLSNCFVIGNEGNSDSYGGIMKTDQEQVQLMKRRGGVGHDLSHIRPSGSAVMNSALTSTGVVPFMERFSNSTREVAQDGRRGALMLSISIKHPDAEHFIDAKLDGTKVTGANVSVRIDDEFMDAAINGKPYIQQYPVNSDNPDVKREVDASAIWKKIVHNAWSSAEPGILFWDTVIKESVPDCYPDEGFTTTSTNPCGEIPLCPYDSCRLLAINLYSYVDSPYTSAAKFDFTKFKDHVRSAQRIMDDIIDLEVEKIDKILEKIEADPEPDEIKGVEVNLWKNIRKKSLQGRRTGVGITAEGDMLAALGLTYGSDESIAFSEKVHKTLAIEAYRSSTELAKHRGAFEVFDATKEKDNPFINRIRKADPDLYQEMLSHGRRNISLLTIAPTGTTSLMTQTTSGIEPVFMVSYKRRRKVNPNDKDARTDMIDEIGDHWEEYPVFHHNFTTWLKVNGYDLDEVEQMDDSSLNKLIEQSPYHKATANDVDWVKKVKLQGTIQKWIDHSISVTVNIPEETPEEMVAQIYQTGWESGCKGVTVYRDGSRSGVLVAKDKKKEKKDVDESNKIIEHHAPKRPQILDAEIVRFQNNHEKWVAVVGIFNDQPYEIFTGPAEDFLFVPIWLENAWVIKNRNEEGRSQYDLQYKDKHGYKVTIEGLSRSFNPEYWNYAKLISGVLRHGMPIPYVVDMVNNLHLNDESLNTWKNGVVRALKKFIPDGTMPSQNICPECGESALIYEEGCLNCKSCGHTKCG
ncbi:MAG: adenosylcobalamin-dependent ribonucleoside-diphosphate reductase [Bacteroidota bacterium]